MEWRPPEYALQNQLPFDQFWSYRDDTYSFGNGIELPFQKMCVTSPYLKNWAHGSRFSKEHCWHLKWNDGRQTTARKISCHLVNFEATGMILTVLERALNFRSKSVCHISVAWKLSPRQPISLAHLCKAGAGITIKEHIILPVMVHNYNSRKPL